MSTRTARPLGPQLALAGTVGKRVDVLVIGLTSTSNGPEIALGDGIVDESVLAGLLDSFVAVGAKGKAEETTRIPAPDTLPVDSVLAVGLGAADKLDAEQIRRSAGAAARSLGGVDTVATTLSSLDLGAAAEGFALGAYRFTEFKSVKSAPGPEAQPVSRVELLVSSPRAKEAKETLARSAAIAEAVATAREFVNTPPSHLFPAEFAERAEALGTEAGLKVEILDEKALEKNGFGGILGVGMGSSRLPRLVRLSYSSKKRNAPKVALVGKGVTFDTGGISIKPAAGMENMTSDMGGAAAVVARTARRRHRHRADGREHALVHRPASR